MPMAHPLQAHWRQLLPRQAGRQLGLLGRQQLQLRLARKAQD